MPLYLFRCSKHGLCEEWQDVNDPHEAICPQCGKAMTRVFTPHAVKCGQVKMGNTREELFQNLAEDGFAPKDWKEHDPYYRGVKGIED